MIMKGKLMQQIESDIIFRREGRAPLFRFTESMRRKLRDSGFIVYIPGSTTAISSLKKDDENVLTEHQLENLFAGYRFEEPCCRKLDEYW
jgi:hypothetical protein